MTSEQALAISKMEENLFEVILRFCRQANLKSTVRCAGGWVRDKLMGVPSDDIDICVDDMSGEAFASGFSSFLSTSTDLSKDLSSKGSKDGSSKEGKDQTATNIKVGVIRANPEKSKHLATATFRIGSVSVDVTHLRHETYADAESRIPSVVRFGTAREDALRRDFTINSLFYNLHTQSIEDFTGRGLSDLQKRILRTPLQASATFLEDPLRLLRAARFAAG